LNLSVNRNLVFSIILEILSNRCKGSERGNSPTLVKRITSESCHTIEDFSFCDDEFEGILGLIAQRYDYDDVISSEEQETGLF